jgi:uncharacterized damage-inducible protein DinB
MPAKLLWIHRRWTFDEPVELFPDQLERLRGTPARLEETVAGLTTAVLTRREAEGTWSIQENVGHIYDVDALPMGRLDDYLANKPTLRPAEMGNRTTHEANYNARSIETVLRDVRKARAALMARLDALSDADFTRSAQHPRLGVPMRLVDMCRFQADHDDYHLARITELKRKFAAR